MNTTPTSGTPAPKPDEPTAVIIVAGTPQFAAFLAGRFELINEPVRQEDTRNRRLQLIGEIVEVAACEELDLTPNQILAIATAALADPELARDLTPANFGIIINKHNGSEQ